MSTHKNIDRICVVITVITLLVTVIFMNGKNLGISAVTRTMGYESTLFDTSRVHTIDIVIDDWDSFLENAAGEEYTPCSVVIDNDSVKNVAIRGKGNTSLSTVAGMGSERYSFKIEFDHYESGKNYNGLDKLCLNNLIQDNTYMKDYLTYRMMAEFGVDAPLCSYVWVTVNGEDWGLYLAVEAIEDSFLSRVYDNEGDVYKPDSMSMGGGPGNGRDFNIEDFMDENADEMGMPWSRDTEESGSGFSQPPGNGTDSQWQKPDWGSGSPDGTNPPQEMPPDGAFGEIPDGASGEMSDGTSAQGKTFPGMPGGKGGGPGMGGGFGMGSGDVKLQYSDDDPDSYSNIFDNAKTDVTRADQVRLIESLRLLGEGKDLEKVLDIDEVMRYFVVHNFTVNGDSYTGSMIHNYYLHESDGRFSMIPWDYNLAFGTFQGGSAGDAVNDPIDTPLSVSGDGSRPMADWIFQSEEYLNLYHQYFAEFLDQVDMDAMISQTYDQIAEYVEKDPTAFCSYEEFQTGVSTLRSFCDKRTESIRGQLEGSIPSTDEGQAADSSSLIDASGITLSDMGSMGSGNGNFGPGSDWNVDDKKTSSDQDSNDKKTDEVGESPAAGSTGSSSFPNWGNGSDASRPNLPGGGPGGFSGQQEGSSFKSPDETGFAPGQNETAGKGLLLELSASILVLTAAILFAKHYR